MEERQLIELLEGIKDHLRFYHPGNNEYIMILCAYRRFLNALDDEILEQLSFVKNQLEALFDSLSAERLKNAVDQFDPYKYLAVVDERKEKNKNGESDWDIESRLYLLMEDGFAALASDLNRDDLIQEQAKRVSQVLSDYGWSDAFRYYRDSYGVAHRFDVPESQNIRRLRDEIDLFLRNYDPNNNEQVILLFAYRNIIDGFACTTKQYLIDRRLRIESLVKSLTSEHLVWCATLFDFDLYFNRFVDNYEKWEKFEITLMELVDSAVYSIVLVNGLYELARYAGDEVVSIDDCIDQGEKHYDFSEYFVWIPMFNEYDRRYGFDSKYDSDDQLDGGEDT